jgi:hypothetical protein
MQVGLQLVKAEAEAEARREALQCAWCGGWVKEDDKRLQDTHNETRDARGGSYRYRK